MRFFERVYRKSCLMFFFVAPTNGRNRQLFDQARVKNCNYFSESRGGGDVDFKFGYRLL